MEQILNVVTEVNGKVNDFIWINVGIIILLATGLIMTVATKAFQFSHLRLWWKNTVGSLLNRDVIRHAKDDHAISPFQALCTALAATIGTGNIAGVAAGIVIGGPGAVLWMWFAALLGMMTGFAEKVLSIYYRRKNNCGDWSGGPMYYLKEGFGSYKGMKTVGKILAILFAVFTLLAAFGIGGMSQINKIVLNIESAFAIPALSEVKLFGDVSAYALVIGLVVTALAAVVVLGGLKRMANVAEKIVPFMVVFFLVGGIAVVCFNGANILPALKAIVETAFVPKAAIGGGVAVLVKKVMTQGFKRGIFSNEAGLGSSAMVHANANVKEPVRQGMWGIFEVFTDTIIVCTLTALIILTSGIYNLDTCTMAEGVTDATLVGKSFGTLFSFGGLGEKFVAVALFLFAFTTILGWNQYGVKAWEYLFGTKTSLIYRILHIVVTFAGALMTSSLAWDISDTFNGFMMIPNLIGVVALTPLVVKITKNYIDRVIRKKDVRPMLSYDPRIEEFNIAHLDNDREIWQEPETKQ